MRKDTDAHRDRMPRITADMPQAFRSIDSAAVTNSSLSVVTTLLHANSDTGSQRDCHKACFHPDTCAFAHAQLWIHSGSTQLTSMPTQPPLETVLPLKFKSSLSPSTLWPCCRTQLPCCQPNKPTSNSELTVSASPEQVEIKIHSRGDPAQHGVLAASGVGPFMSG